MDIAAIIWKLYLIKMSKWFMVFMPIVVLFFQSNGLNLREVMTINAIYSLSTAFFEIPSGYFSDKFGRKHSIIIGTLFITFQFLVYSWSFDFWSMSVGAVIGGLGASFISGSDSALLYELTSDNKLKASNNFEEISSCDAILICVPTPLGKNNDPDISYVIETGKSIAPYLNPEEQKKLKDAVSLYKDS